MNIVGRTRSWRRTSRSSRIPLLKCPWVQFPAGKLIRTDAELVRTDSDRVLSRIYLVQVEDRWLLALLNPKVTENVIEGELIAGRPYWPKEIDEVAQETAAIHHGQLLPFVVLGYDDHLENNQFGFYFFLFCSALGGLSLVGGLCACSCRRTKHRSPRTIAAPRMKSTRARRPGLPFPTAARGAWPSRPRKCGRSRADK